MPKSTYGSKSDQYGRWPEYQQLGSKYGSRYSQKPEFEGTKSEYRFGYGRKLEYNDGSKYGRRPGFDHPASKPSQVYCGFADFVTGFTTNLV
ncbi:hypothetical protein SLE2022_011670 [Rubroshorea leprosula]